MIALEHDSVQRGSLAENIRQTYGLSPKENRSNDASISEGNESLPLYGRYPLNREHINWDYIVVIFHA